ncbi:polyketide synthase dehydratase domain-containing protein, partial [Sphaerisporangium sp. TRM90804]
VLVAAQRRNRPQAHTLVSALGELHVAGADVDWRAFFSGTAARRVDLPTYAFQRERYWVEGEPGVGDVSAAGLTAMGHALLGAAVVLADSGGVVCTGRLSVGAQPWLADHVVGGSVVFPGTGFVELVLGAGEQVGFGGLEELMLQAPLVLPATGAMVVQVVVGPQESGRRSVSVHSRSEDQPDQPWTLHAQGALVPVSDGSASPREA